MSSAGTGRGALIRLLLSVALCLLPLYLVHAFLPPVTGFTYNAPHFSYHHFPFSSGGNC